MKDFSRNAGRFRIGTIPTEETGRRADRSERCREGQHDKCSGVKRENHGIKAECLCKCGHPHVKAKDDQPMKIMATVVQLRCATCNRQNTVMRRDRVEAFARAHAHHPGYSLLLDVEHPDFIAGFSVSASLGDGSK